MVDLKIRIPIYILRFIVIIFGRFYSWVVFSFEDFLALSNIRKIFNLILIIFSFYIFFIIFIVKMKGFYIKKLYFFLRSMWFMSILSRLLFLQIFKKIRYCTEGD